MSTPYLCTSKRQHILACSPVHTLSAFFVVAEGQLQTTEASKPLKTAFLDAEEDTHIHVEMWMLCMQRITLTSKVGSSLSLESMTVLMHKRLL